MARSSGKTLKVVNKRLTMHVSEDGHVSETPTPLYLDSTGSVSFVYLLPQYVQDALGEDERVAASTAEKALDDYKDALRRYVDHVRTAAAEPVIILNVDVDYEARDAENRYIRSSRHFGSLGGKDKFASVQVTYELAFRVNGSIHDRREIEAIPEGSVYPKGTGEFKPGTRRSHVPGKVLPYTPELHQKLDLIIEALSQAARKLHEIDEAEDAAGAVLSLGGMLALTEK